MRRLDEVARFWNDTRSRLPQGAWSWPMVAAGAGALVIVLGTAAWERPAGAKTAPSASAGGAIERPAGCAVQTWPYLDRECLRGSQPDQVRVLKYDPALAAAAIGATQWAPKHTLPSRQPPSRHKQASHDPDRTVTVRSGRRGRDAARERTYTVPADAFRSYGYARR